MKKVTALGLFAVFTIASFSVKAQDESPAIDITGFADLYYQYNFNENASGLTSFTEAHNSFELGMINLVFSTEFGKAGLVADLGFGPRADVANGFAGSTLAPIKQLYLTYAFSDRITLTAGNFGTHVGYEIIDAPGNFNYSTSYMFSYGPFYHTGVKLDVGIADNIGFMVGFFNDTDSKTDLNDTKHFGAQLSYSLGGLDAYFNFLGGNEDGVDGSGNNSFQYDITATFQASDKLMVGLNTTTKVMRYSEDETLGSIPNDQWFGGALYLNYTVTDDFALGFRGEYFDDTDALNIFDIATFPDGGNLVDLTLSANIKSGPLTFIPEFRVDIASEDIFTDANGLPAGTSPTVLTALVYSF